MEKAPPPLHMVNKIDRFTSIIVLRLIMAQKKYNSHSNPQSLKNEIQSDISDILENMERWPAKKNAFIKSFVDLYELISNFHGKKILEIGCDRHLLSAQYFIIKGAEKVVVTSLIADKILKNPAKIDIFSGDVTKMDFAEKFDLIFGRAILEHIADIRALSGIVNKYLRPNGVAYFDGGPMWYSVNGAHVWFMASSSTQYTFATNNPLKAYEHLIYTEDQLTNILEARIGHKGDAKEIVNYVYHSKDQNRLSNKEIVSAFQKSGLVVDYKEEQSCPVPDSLLEYFEKAKLSQARLIVKIKKVNSC